MDKRARLCPHIMCLYAVDVYIFIANVRLQLFHTACAKDVGIANKEVFKDRVQAHELEATGTHC